MSLPEYDPEEGTEPTDAEIERQLALYRGALRAGLIRKPDGTVA